MLKHVLVALLLLLLGDPALAQKNTVAYQKLVKRYGSVTPWANGYIIKANSFYGFANAEGRFVLPITYFKFDTLLNDGAGGWNWEGYQYELIDGNGKKIVQASGQPYGPANRKRRLLALKSSDGKEMLCNENGANSDL